MSNYSSYEPEKEKANKTLSNQGQGHLTKQAIGSQNNIMALYKCVFIDLTSPLLLTFNFKVIQGLWEKKNYDSYFNTENLISTKIIN
jgi:hypothetical protein